MWIDGPTFLHLVDADADREVREVNITCLKTSPNQVLNGTIFKIFHIENVLGVVVNIKSLASRKHIKFPQNISVFEAEILIIKGLQITSFSDEIEAIIEGRSPPRNSFFIAFEI